MKNKKPYTREELLDILACYKRMIERADAAFSGVVLDDIEKSIAHVLQANNYTK